jgi:hypothetical protein
LTFNTTKKWCLCFVAVVLTSMSVVAAINYSVDFYGLFRDSHNRGLKIYTNERTSKYLFSYRYIPDNFDGVLFGSSISDNWDVSRAVGFRVYNASLSGGNVSEEKLIAENIFKRKKMKLAIFCIHPYLTMNHGRKSGYMNTSEYWGALGSIQLFREYSNRSKPMVDENGVEKLEDLTGVILKKPEVNPAALEHTNSVIVIDEIAVAEYKELVASARLNGAKIVAFVPPFSVDVYESNKIEYDQYIVRMSTLFDRDVKIINFNTPAYENLRKEKTTFFDGAHLSDKAAAYFSAELATAINAP